MQRAGHSRVCHRANKNRDVLSKTTREDTEVRTKTRRKGKRRRGNYQNKVQC